MSNEAEKNPPQGNQSKKDPQQDISKKNPSQDRRLSAQRSRETRRSVAACFLSNSFGTGSC
jgi:hypothetical protein